MNRRINLDHDAIQAGIESFRAMGSAADRAARSIRDFIVLWQKIQPPLPWTVLCKLCGNRYEVSAGIDVDGICPDCTETLKRVAEKMGRTVSATDLEALTDRSSHWTDEAIRYGRPWQEHVPAHSRHLIRDRA